MITLDTVMQRMFTVEYFILWIKMNLCVELLMWYSMNTDVLLRYMLDIILEGLLVTPH